MTAPTREQVTEWWATMAAHRPRDGRCPVCDTRARCWPYATAMAELIAHDRYHLGPLTTPAATPGGNPTAGHHEGESPDEST